MLDNFVFGMSCMNLTQVGPYYDGKSHLSHRNKEIDNGGWDTGIDCYRNMMKHTALLCAGMFGNKKTGNTRYFWTVDPVTHKPKKVRCADGKDRYITLAMTHCNKDIPVGKVFGYKEMIYYEGTSGNATGNHIHIEVCEGTVKEKKQILGSWNLPNMLDVRDIFFILDGYTTVKNAKGLVFKHVSDSTVNEDQTADTSKELKLVNIYGKNKRTRQIATSFHVYKKLGSKPLMELKQYKFEGSDITAVQIQMNDNTDLGLSYVGYREWLENLHNEWMFSHGWEEVMAMNAGYFEMKTGKPVGAVMKDWSSQYATFNGAECVPARDNGYPTLGWTGERMELLNAYANEIDLSKYAWLVGVGQSLVINGKVDNSVGTQNGRFYSRNCTTCIGFNHSKRLLTFAINSNGTLNTLQRSHMMQQLGCDIAVQLDGGESAQLAYLQSALTNAANILTTTANLNLRTEPNGKVLKVLPKGTQVNWFWEEKDGFYKVYIPSMNLQGYVSSKYVK